jgi:hypothetical protein
VVEAKRLFTKNEGQTSESLSVLLREDFTEESTERVQLPTFHCLSVSPSPNESILNAKEWNM